MKLNFLKTNMKLLYCPACNDVVRLVEELRTCDLLKNCGRAAVEAHGVAIHNGIGTPIMIDNESMSIAHNLRKEGETKGRKKFPIICRTISDRELQIDPIL